MQCGFFAATAQARSTSRRLADTPFSQRIKKMSKGVANHLVGATVNKTGFGDAFETAHFYTLLFDHHAWFV